MKRVTVVCVMVLLVLSLAPTASAGKPGGEVFSLAFTAAPHWTWTTEPPKDTLECKHIKTLSFTQTGVVVFPKDSELGDMGTWAFDYDEHISVNPNKSEEAQQWGADWLVYQATEQGDLTLTLAGGDGDIDIRFVGRADVYVIEGENLCTLVNQTPEQVGNKVVVLVNDQPWNIVSGEVDFDGDGDGVSENVHGNGTRSTSDSLCTIPNPWDPSTTIDVPCVNYSGEIQW